MRRRYTINIDAELVAELKALSFITRRSISDIINEAVRRYLDAIPEERREEIRRLRSLMVGGDADAQPGQG